MALAGCQESIVTSFFKYAAVALALATALCGQATAKAVLVSSQPEVNAAVSGRLHQIALTFSEGIEIDLSRINVRGPKGVLRTTVVASDQKTVVLVAFWDTPGLGRYTVDWHVVSSSRQKSHGTYKFSVQRLTFPLELLPPPEASAEKFEKAPAVVDLNTASANDLATLPGIGATQAAAIVAGRPYELVDQLVSKGIVAQATFDKIKNDMVVAGVAAKSGGDEKQAPAATEPVDVNTATADELDAGVAAKSGGDEKQAPAATGPVDVNTATVDELDALPGVGPTRAARIVAGRPYKSIDDL